MLVGMLTGSFLFSFFVVCLPGGVSVGMGYDGVDTRLGWSGGWGVFRHVGIVGSGMLRALFYSFVRFSFSEIYVLFGGVW